MADSYEVTCMYRVQLPEGTEDTLKEEFSYDEENDVRAIDEVLTELISEVMHNYQTSVSNGPHESNWVFLNRAHEMWSAGWYEINTNMPQGWENSTVEILQRLCVMPNTSLRVVVTGVVASDMGWVWEQE